MFGTGTRNARAISSVVRPPSTRSVSATRASFERTGWHAMKMRPRSSSPNSSSIDVSKSLPRSCRSTSRPSSSYLRSSVLRRRTRSVARCFAVAISQAPGRSGTPDAGHCSSAATRASCASSSAVPISPTRRASRAMSRADSIRQIASIARCASPPRGPMTTAPSRAFVHGHLTDLECSAVVGCPLEPFDGFVHRAHLPQPVPGHELLGLCERAVNHGALVAVEPNTLSLWARREAARGDDDPSLDELFVELLVRSHCLRRWRGRRFAPLTFLRHHEHTHPCLLSGSSLIHTSNDTRPFRHRCVKDHAFRLRSELLAGHEVRYPPTSCGWILTGSPESAIRFMIC